MALFFARIYKFIFLYGSLSPVYRTYKMLKWFQQGGVADEMGVWHDHGAIDFSFLFMCGRDGDVAGTGEGKTCREDSYQSEKADSAKAG